MRSVMVTGASSGIGAALARRLAAPGTRLGLIGRNRPRLDAVARDCEARGAICRIGQFDVTDGKALADYHAAFEAEAPTDLLIGNAGILGGRPADGGLEDAATARQVLETNLIAAVDTVNLVLPGMRARRRGQIVLVSSLAAFSPLADAPAYSAAKAGLLAYGLALRQALAGEGIEVIVSCPGYVATAMAEKHAGSRPYEVTADDAAMRILSALARRRALSGFPLPLYWPARLSQIMPEWARRLGTRGLGFHVR